MILAIYVKYITDFFVILHIGIDRNYSMAKKNQSERLTVQHKESKGVVGIFCEEAKLHDSWRDFSSCY